LYNQEWKAYMDSQHSKNFQLERGGWLADYVDPHVFFDMWETNGGNNDTNSGSPEYDRLLHSALAAPTEAARYEIFHQMETTRVASRLATTRVPVLFSRTPCSVSSRRVSCSRCSRCSWSSRRRSSWCASCPAAHSRRKKPSRPKSSAISRHIMG